MDVSERKYKFVVYARCARRDESLNRASAASTYNAVQGRVDYK